MYVYMVRPIIDDENWSKKANTIYIGATTNWYKTRFVKHKSDYRKKNYSSTTCMKVFEKYGIDNVEVICLQKCKNKNEMYNTESKYIIKNKEYCVNKKQ